MENKNKKKFTAWQLGGLLGLLACSAAHAAADSQCQVVRFADVGWTDVTMTTATARLVLDELGYRAHVSRLSLPDTYGKMAQGEIDVFLGNWMPAQSGLIRPHLQAGTIETLQTNLQGVRYTLAVLDDAYQAGLRDFADIARFKTELNGQIFGIEPGNKGNEMLKDMVRDDTFGLNGFTIVESSEGNMLNHVERAQRLGKWAVFLGWQPHPMNDRLRMQYLSGGDAFFGADYGAATVHTVVRKGFAEQCPNLARLFRNMTFTIADENQLMTGALEGNTNRRRVAKAWLQEHPATSERWLQGVTRFDGAAADKLFQGAQSKSNAQ